MNKCCCPIELRYAQGVGEDQHGTVSVGAVGKCTEIDTFGTLAGNAQVEGEVFVQNVAVDKSECREDCLIVSPGDVFETDKQVKTPDNEWSRRRVVHADSATWGSRIVVQT